MFSSPSDGSPSDAIYEQRVKDVSRGVCGRSETFSAVTALSSHLPRSPIHSQHQPHVAEGKDAIEEDEVRGHAHHG